MLKKLKSYLEIDHIFYGILILFVGVASFLLGRYSVIEESQNMDSQVVEVSKLVANTEKNIASNTETDNLAEDEVVVVASKSGTKYHLLSCPGAKTIKTENLITFSSAKEAEAGGYKRAQNCP